MYRHVIVICLLLLFFGVIGLDTGSASHPEGKATIKELTATASATHLLVFCTLENSFNSEMTEMVHSGIPVKFSFFIELYKTTKNWPNEQVAAFNFQHIMSYDTLKENYRITLEEDNNRVLSCKSLAEGQKILNEINGAKVVALNQLIPDNRYTLKIRAELYQKTLPLSLHNALPFFSWWDVETDWHSIEFTY